MSGSNSAVATSSTSSNASNRARFGNSGQPMVVARLFGRDNSFPNNHGIVSRAYIGFIMVAGVLNWFQFNTYNRNGAGEGVGKHFTPRLEPVDMADAKSVQRRLKGYTPVDVASFSLVTAQTGTDGTAANTAVDQLLAWKPAPTTDATTTTTAASGNGKGAKGNK